MNLFTKSAWRAAGLAMISVGTAAAESASVTGPSPQTVATEPLEATQKAAEESADAPPASRKADASGSSSPLILSSDEEPAETETPPDGLDSRSVSDRRERIASCMTHHEQAQVARLSGRFLDSAHALKECASLTCPEALRIDCIEWRQELDELIPTVLIVAEGDSGDLEEARVLVDDQVVREQLDGRPIALDPGTHLLRVLLPDGRSQKRRIVLSEGDRGRRLRFSFGENSPTISPPGPPKTRVMRPVPPGVSILGATAFIGMGVAVGFGSDAWSKARTARDLCAPLCDDDVSKAVSQRAAIADVALGVAVASTIGAIVVYSYRPERVVPLGEVTVGWEQAPRGGGLKVAGAF